MISYYSVCCGPLPIIGLALDVLYYDKVAAQYAGGKIEKTIQIVLVEMSLRLGEL